MADKRIIDLAAASGVFSGDLIEKSDSAASQPSQKMTVGQLQTYMQDNLDFPSATVTSVGLTMPSGFSVSGSPVTSTGTLAVDTSWRINTSRSYVFLGQSPSYPASVTNSTTNDQFFTCSVFLTNTPGQSTTVNLVIDGGAVLQVSNVCELDVAGTQLGLPFSFILAPGKTASVQLNGQAQEQGPIFTYISL
jgi:hypothetical protein